MVHQPLSPRSSSAWVIQDVQFLPVEVEGHARALVHPQRPTHVLRCIDEARHGSIGWQRRTRVPSGKSRMNRYFKLLDDRRSRDRWHLGAPVDEQGGDRPVAIR